MLSDSCEVGIGNLEFRNLSQLFAPFASFAVDLLLGRKFRTYAFGA